MIEKLRLWAKYCQKLLKCFAEVQSLKNNDMSGGYLPGQKVMTGQGCLWI